MTTDYAPGVKRLTAERLKWRGVVPMSVEVREEPWAGDWLAKQMVAMVEVHLLSREVRTETSYTLELPVSWFQHFKLAVFPEWLKRCFPPRTRSVPVTVKHYHNCPHVDAPRNGSAHLHWLALSHEDSDD